VQAKIREAEAAKTLPNTVLSGNAANNQEQLPNPATGLPAPQETGDTTPKGPSGTLPEDSKFLLEASEAPEKL